MARIPFLKLFCSSSSSSTTTTTSSSPLTLYILLTAVIISSMGKLVQCTEVETTTTKMTTTTTTTFTGDMEEQRYLKQNMVMNSRALLLICTALCFVVFFYCCLRLVITVTYESSIDQGSAELTPDAMREAILSNLSVFQRRAILEVFFRNEIFSCSKAKKKSKLLMEGKKLQPQQHPQQNPQQQQEDDDKDVVDEGSIVDIDENNDHQRMETMVKYHQVGTPRVALDLKQNLLDETEQGLSFGTPSTQQSLSPESHTHKELKIYDSTTSPDSSCVKLSVIPLRNRNHEMGSRSDDNYSSSDSMALLGQHLYLDPIKTKLNFPIACASVRVHNVHDYEDELVVEEQEDGDEGYIKVMLGNHTISSRISKSGSSSKSGITFPITATENTTTTSGSSGSGNNNSCMGQETDRWQLSPLMTEDCDDNQDVENHHQTVASKTTISEDEITSSSEAVNDVIEDGNMCSICLDDYDEGDSIVKSKHCTHFFHRECIIQWLEREKSDYKCPCCRNHMVTTDELREAASCIHNEDTMIGNDILNNSNTGSSNDRGDVTRSHFGIGRMIRGYRSPTSPPASPRRRTYSDESPIFIPDV